ncbi:hypothetical protein ACEWY4_013370 [Coilia grayii]|uniref:Ig-like domain-containing protein n=1 Tax=Coilia grayii TaxID=363190 RepID=A0ABD1JW51_9TELE
MLVDIVLFSFLFFVSSAVRHSLVIVGTYISNITDFPNYVETTMLDNETVSHYDSNSRRTAPIQQFEEMDQSYLDNFTKQAQLREGQFNGNALELKDYWKRDGKLIAGEGKGKLNPSEKLNQDMCVDCLKIYAQHRDRKVKPVVAVFYSESKCSVLCQAKGFYPKYLNMTWKMGGKELQEDVLVGKTLPSGNRTFQKEAVLTVVPVEGINRQLTCEVAHVTGVITETITVEGPSVGIWFWIAVGEVLVVLVVLVLFLCVWRKCPGCTSSTSCCNQSPAESHEPLQSNADPAPDNNAA